MATSTTGTALTRQAFEGIAEDFQNPGILRESAMGGDSTAQGLGRERPRPLSKLQRARTSSRVDLDLHAAAMTHVVRNELLLLGRSQATVPHDLPRVAAAHVSAVCSVVEDGL